VRQADEAVAAAYTLTQDFATMLRERQGARLDGWLAAALASAVPALRRFALGLLKRQGYGRAGFTLLRQRVLRAAS
jgi:transposase